MKLPGWVGKAVKVIGVVTTILGKGREIGLWSRAKK
jgi:hypothetical protein